MEASNPKTRKPILEATVIEAKAIVRGRPAREGDKNRVGVPVVIIPPKLPQSKTRERPDTGGPTQERPASAEARSLPTRAEMEQAAGYLGRLMLYLRKQRELRGMSFADVAAKSGLDRGMLCKLEKGGIPNPTFLTLWRYAGALENPPAQIFLAACRSATEADQGGVEPPPGDGTA
jgi:hypothetical protein